MREDYIQLFLCINNLSEVEEIKHVLMGFPNCVKVNLIVSQVENRNETFSFLLLFN